MLNIKKSLKDKISNINLNDIISIAPLGLIGAVVGIIGFTEYRSYNLANSAEFHKEIVGKVVAESRDDLYSLQLKTSDLKDIYLTVIDAKGVTGSSLDLKIDVGDEIGFPCGKAISISYYPLKNRNFDPDQPARQSYFDSRETYFCTGNVEFGTKRADRITVYKK